MTAQVALLADAIVIESHVKIVAAEMQPATLLSIPFSIPFAAYAPLREGGFEKVERRLNSGDDQVGVFEARRRLVRGSIGLFSDWVGHMVCPCIFSKVTSFDN